MTKREEGLESRLRRFFTENPDEELTFALITVKFDVSIMHAREVVARMVAAEELESVHLVRARAKGIAK